MDLQVFSCKGQGILDQTSLHAISLIHSGEFNLFSPRIYFFQDVRYKVK